ncbi:Peptidoglycan endopeptidase RipA precursor [Actinomyces howellii]|uniref:Peptidoglycan endopeptidase RipA n=1 Tax=Actinomyces howellii TaxID=52771 RepID=A0A448HJU3_9ACTO|nr:Peptidoglycan endopeptidase RipA precursor [Actinomyces howellii]
MVGVLPLLVLVPMMMGGGDSEQETESEPLAAGAGGVAGVPAEYVGAVVEAGTLCPEVSAPVIAAQIWTESKFDPLVGSPMGAQGIAQFMPETWADFGTDGDGDGVADVWNPADAILSQGVYMCHLVDMVRGYLDSGTAQGDLLELTLAAYNAGPGAVADAGGLPVNGETELYVPLIIGDVPRFTGTQGVVVDSGGGPVADKAIAAARGYLGTPYVWAGESAAGLDCSGLTMLAYRAAGVSLEHSSRKQYGQGTRVPLAEASPGDLVFWSYDGTESGIYHVAIFLGDGMMIESPTFGQTVRETEMRTQGAMPYAVRPY